MKTLKDLFDKEDIEDKVVIDILRKEAIKWVKFKDWDDDSLILKLWIKHFFNLTEEDLQ